MSFQSTMQPGRTEVWLRIVLVIMSVLSAFAFVQTAGADGATQIAGSATPIPYGVAGCDDPEGAGSDFVIDVEGDLGGCVYVFVESAQCSSGGVVFERGRELYVGSGAAGDNGTFETSYQFTGKFEDCPNYSGQIFGRCQHPIVAGSGTGDYEGVAGRLDFKDNVEAGTAEYRGHLRYGN